MVLLEGITVFCANIWLERRSEMMAGEEVGDDGWTCGTFSDLWRTVHDVFEGVQGWWKVDKMSNGSACVVVCREHSGEDDQVIVTADRSQSGELGFLWGSRDPTVEDAPSGSQIGLDGMCYELLATGCDIQGDMVHKVDGGCEFEFQPPLDKSLDGGITRGTALELFGVLDKDEVVWCNDMGQQEGVLVIDICGEEVSTRGLIVDEVEIPAVDGSVCRGDSQPPLCCEMASGHFEEFVGVDEPISSCGDALSNGPMIGPCRKVGSDSDLCSPYVAVEALSKAVDPNLSSPTPSPCSNAMIQDQFAYIPIRPVSTLNPAGWVGSFPGFNESHPDPGEPVTEPTESSDPKSGGVLFAPFCVSDGHIFVSLKSSPICSLPTQVSDRNGGSLGNTGVHGERLIDDVNYGYPRILPCPKKCRIRKGWTRPKPGFAELLAGARVIETQRLEARRTHKLGMSSSSRPSSSASSDLVSPICSGDNEAHTSSLWADFCCDGFL